VIKDLKSKSKGYRLSEGDIVRLGRINLRVYELGGFENS